MKQKDDITYIHHATVLDNEDKVGGKLHIAGLSDLCLR